MLQIGQISLLVVLIFSQQQQQQNKFTNSLRLTEQSRNEAPKSQAVKQQQQQQQQQQFAYGVIVDCGSSGTRAHIFRWPRPAGPVEQLRDPRTNAPLIKQIRPGLSSVRDRPGEASDYMRPIMDFLAAKLPAEAQPGVRVSFLATAGLRLLAAEVRANILADLERDLPLEYPQLGANLSARAIAGTEEGLYQWLSVNHHANRLGPGFDLAPGPLLECQAPRARRFAFIEMGGASVQVSYELSPAVESLVERALVGAPLALEAFRQSRIELAGSGGGGPGAAPTMRVFSTTFAGFGSNYARQLAVALLIRQTAVRLARHHVPLYYAPNGTMLLDDPCLPAGAHEHHRQPLRLLLDPTGPIGYELDEHDEQAFTVRLLGGGNFARCQLLLGQVIVAAKREHLNCNSPDGQLAARSPFACSVDLLGTHFIPFRLFQWLGLGELYYTTDSLVKLAGRFNIRALLRRTAGVCSTPYRALKTLYPEADRVDEARTRQQCFKASWLISLLQVGFRMAAESDLETVNQINGNPTDWTIGAMIARQRDGEPPLASGADRGAIA